MDTMGLREFPPTLFEDIAKRLSDYTVGLVKLPGDENSVGAAVGGSGTLVRVDQRHAILTAAHVLDDFGTTQNIGLILATRFTPILHRYVLQSEAVNPVEVACGRNGAEDPDLGLLLLSEADVAALGALKSFYDLALHVDQALVSPRALDDGAWFMFGFAEEFTKDLPPERGFDQVKVFQGTPCLGYADGSFETAGFDYLDFVPVAGGSELPHNCGGFSGAGLWEARLERRADGALAAAALILSGAAFHQSALVDGARTIRCHGRRSVYLHALDQMRLTNRGEG